MRMNKIEAIDKAMEILLYGKVGEERSKARQTLRSLLKDAEISAVATGANGHFLSGIGLFLMALDRDMREQKEKDLKREVKKKKVKVSR